MRAPRRIRLGILALVGVAAGGLLPALGGPAVPVSASPHADAASNPPPFPLPPRLLAGGVERDYAISRAELSYRKADGREIGGWRVELYAPHARMVPERPPQDTDAAAAAAPDPRPLIIILPFGGIRKDASLLFSRGFVEDGFMVLRLPRPPPEAEGPVLHSLKGTAKSLGEDALNLRRVIAWATSLPGVDRGRVGVIGVSRGAIVAALAAQTTPTLSTVLVLGGADLAGLFRDSKIEIVERMRRVEVERAGGDLGQAVARAAKVLAPVDPARRPGRLDPQRTLLIQARWDRVIPRAQAEALREAAGGARQVWLPSGHNTSLLFARRVRRLSREHFKRTLG